MFVLKLSGIQIILLSLMLKLFNANKNFDVEIDFF